MAYLVKKTHKKQSVGSANAAGLVTFDQFYDIVEENVKADLLDGKIIRDSPPVPKHALIVTWVGRLAGDYAEAFNLGIVVGANTTVRLTQYHGRVLRKSGWRMGGN